MGVFNSPCRLSGITIAKILDSKGYYLTNAGCFMCMFCLKRTVDRFALRLNCTDCYFANLLMGILWSAAVWKVSNYYYYHSKECTSVYLFKCLIACLVCRLWSQNAFYSFHHQHTRLFTLAYGTVMKFRKKYLVQSMWVRWIRNNMQFVLKLLLANKHKIKNK